MKKFSILIQLRFLYVYLLLYMIAGYFYNSKLKELGYYEFMKNYFGNFTIFLMIILCLNIYSFFIKCKKSKMVYNIRVIFFILLGIATIFLWGAYKLELPFEKIVADEKILESSIRIFVYKYKLGIVLAFIFNYCLNKIYFNYFYVMLYSIIFIAMFFIIAKRVRMMITTAIIRRREKKKREIERKLIQEQIELMEALERKERLQRKMEENKEKVEDDTGI